MAAAPLRYLPTTMLVNRFHGAWSYKSSTTCFPKATMHSSSISQDNEREWTTEIGKCIDNSSNNKLLQVVLFSPQIPGNTGCVARTCAATNVGLHLVEPLGFQIDDTKLKRAGLDYWPYVVIRVHKSWNEFMSYFRQQHGAKRLIAFTRRGSCRYTKKVYKPGDWLVFGSETTGLSPEAISDCANEEEYGGGLVRIPMIDTHVRSLNLAVAAGIGLYEVLRQINALEDIDAEVSYHLEEPPLMDISEM